MNIFISHSFASIFSFFCVNFFDMCFFVCIFVCKEIEKESPWNQMGSEGGGEVSREHWRRERAQLEYRVKYSA